MRWPASFRLFLSWSGRDRSLVLSGFLWLTLAQMAVALLPFRWIAPHLGRPGAPPEGLPDGAGVALSAERLSQARAVARGLNRAMRKHPLSPVCLPTAIAGRIMLVRRHLPATLVLGMRRGGEVGLEAHAWLYCGPVPVAGVGQADKYHPIHWYESGSQSSEDGKNSCQR